MRSGVLQAATVAARHDHAVQKRLSMEIILVIVLVLMLGGVAYAQWQRGVVRTTGPYALDEDDTNRSAT